MRVKISKYKKVVVRKMAEEIENNVSSFQFVKSKMDCLSWRVLDLQGKQNVSKGNLQSTLKIWP